MSVSVMLIGYRNIFSATADETKSVDSVRRKGRGNTGKLAFMLQFPIEVFCEVRRIYDLLDAFILVLKDRSEHES